MKRCVIHCRKAECREAVNSAHWEVVGDVGCALCRLNGVEWIAQNQGEGLECSQWAGKCAAGQQVGAECTVECHDQLNPITCHTIKCITIPGVQNAGWSYLGQVEC